MFFILQSTKFPSCQTENILQRKRPHWETSDNLTCFFKKNIVTFIESNYLLNNNLSNSVMSINRVSCMIESKEVTTKKPVFCVLVAFTFACTLFLITQIETMIAQVRRHTSCLGRRDRAQVKYDGKPYIRGSACTSLLSAGEQEKLHWAASDVGHVLK